MRLFVYLIFRPQTVGRCVVASAARSPLHRTARPRLTLCDLAVSRGLMPAPRESGH